jgi:RsiW-degrading membrane proteinase PrsW (M82 family)
MEILSLVILAVIPPMAFLLYINHLDRIEPEPHGLILKALLLGAAAVIPAGITEALLDKAPLFAAGGFAGAASKSFIVIAPVEEAVKLAVVLLFIWNNANFNEENDGIVYVGAASIGFSLLENVLYVLDSGLGAGIMRAVTAIPLHTFTGVIMGYFVGVARFAPSPAQRNKKICAGLLIAYLVHGAYDTLVLSGTGAAFLVVPLIVILFVFGIIYLKKGVALSARRWGINPAGLNADQGDAPRTKPVNTPPDAAVQPKPERSTYKIIISRAIFILCAVFWALLIIGMIEQTGTEQGGIFEIIAGGIILTFIPVLIGIILEISHKRQLKCIATGI